MAESAIDSAMKHYWLLNTFKGVCLGPFTLDEAKGEKETRAKLMPEVIIVKRFVE